MSVFSPLYSEGNWGLLNSHIELALKCDLAEKCFKAPVISMCKEIN